MYLKSFLDLLPGQAQKDIKRWASVVSDIDAVQATDDYNSETKKGIQIKFISSDNNKKNLKLNKNTNQNTRKKI